MASPLTELWGNAVFKFVLNGAILASIEYAPAYTFPVVLCTVFLLIVLLAFPFGAHLNCTISVAAVATGDLPVTSGLANIAAQLVGSIVAMTAIRATAPEHLHQHVGPPSPGGDVVLAFALEAIFTFTNVIAAFASEDIWGPRWKAVGTAAIVLVEIIVGGASMDPSGAFAGSYFKGDWAHHLEVYWAGPMLGAVLAGLTWREHPFKLKGKSD